MAVSTTMYPMMSMRPERDHTPLTEVALRAMAAISEIGVFDNSIDNRSEFIRQARFLREMGMEFTRRARAIVRGKEPAGYAAPLKTPPQAQRGLTEPEMADALNRLAATMQADLGTLMESREEDTQVRTLYDLGRAMVDHGTYMAVWLALIDPPSRKLIGKHMGVTAARVSQWKAEEKSAQER